MQEQFDSVIAMDGIGLQYQVELLSPPGFELSNKQKYMCNIEVKLNGHAEFHAWNRITEFIDSFEGQEILHEYMIDKLCEFIKQLYHNNFKHVTIYSNVNRCEKMCLVAKRTIKGALAESE